MATTTGSSGVVKISTPTGTLTAVGEVRSYTIDVTADTIEDSVIGDTARTYKQGLSSATLTIEAYWDEADAQQEILDERALVKFELFPTGTGDGQKSFEGDGVVTSRSITASFDGMVEASFSIQVSGAITEHAN